ncbi:MAG: heavy metal translocating P-type ATPase [Lachnospiraceae bacterium]|nr:heavy metal translocating P-type ATPase [Lachnospiraceae bacterium]
MNRKQKKVLIRIIISAILVATLSLLPVLGLPLEDLMNGWLEPGLFMIPYLIIGYDILLEAGTNILRLQPFDECFLMALATVGAIILGDYKEGVAVMLFYQIGELFQSCAVDKSRRSIAELMDIRPDYANLLQEDGHSERVDPDEVAIGSLILVQSGEKVPIDGVVTEGSSFLDTGALTGESVPRRVEPGDEVISGCINQSGLLTIRTTREFGESTASKILELVEASGMKKSRSEQFITRFARIYTPAVVYAAMALALVPPLVRLLMGTTPAWSDWVLRALTFLVISCPCALVISIPLSFFGGIGGASRQGILIKGSTYLEALAKTRIVAFDKTGTLTKGVFDVDAVEALHLSESELLEAAALAESHSSHPISQSLRRAYAARCDCPPDLSRIQSVEEISGRGVVALISNNNNENNRFFTNTAGDHTNASYTSDGKEIDANTSDDRKADTKKTGVKRIAVGSKKLMEDLHVVMDPPVSTAKSTINGQPFGQETSTSKETTPPSFVDILSEEDSSGTLIYVAIDGIYQGRILIRDVLKPTSARAIEGLKAAGVRRTVMLTGDVRSVAESVAKELQVDRVYSELLPQDKVLKVEAFLEEKSSKECLAFVGDGINDAPVLSRADLGIAMGALGSDAAIEAADIVLMDDDPMKLVKAIRIATKCLRIVYQNIYFAIGVKVLCLILGALGIANMWLAIFADVGVMVIAVLNAMRAMSVRD